MSKISAKIVADSKSKTSGDRLTTFIVTFPRIVLAELNTHRKFSRNSASSRAIPFKKMVESVETNPFIPIGFQKDHSGMQGTEYFTGWREKVIKLAWISASKAAVFAAKKLSKLGLTKQLCNRLLEPFMWHTVIITSSDYENFFALRAHDAAEIHIAKLAEIMLDEYNRSIPKELSAGEWHIPFGDNIDEEQLFTLIEKDHGVYDPILKMQEISGGISPKNQELINNYKLKIAIARCARISYTVVGEENKSDNYVNDIKLHDRLIASGHMSPTEHVAYVMNHEQYAINWGESGNFTGFIQYRKLLSNENQRDNRVLKK